MAREYQVAYKYKSKQAASTAYSASHGIALANGARAYSLILDRVPHVLIESDKPLSEDVIRRLDEANSEGERIHERI
ncbi:MAG: hypothetical protein A2172_00140 [Candidatus Woykebacteria bacterium RBG_13_40_15]|uniref:Uncharacterized protein n=1 Tax=Candidatus Woykebacteria bacterium RBG_13_40_15 TaxID=1802593 RepID=A0A1G1W9A5_9BACT|nr:MAG: hypothetical protein A2172_00140 [Candidatus Woykebacteria bacterium RBG_13_40_15]